MVLFSKNPNAVHIINNFINNYTHQDYDELKENNYYEIMYTISGNINAIELIKTLMPNINYKLLSSNPNALDILLDYMIENDNFYDKIFTVRVPNSEILYSLIYNPSLFEIDYMRMAKKELKLFIMNL